MIGAITHNLFVPSLHMPNGIRSVFLRENRVRMVFGIGQLKAVQNNPQNSNATNMGDAQRLHHS